MAGLPSQRAEVPIRTEGNWFWRGEERFLIKGIAYLPRKDGDKPYGKDSRIDPLDETRLDELRRDIEIFRELGLNTIQVSALSLEKSHWEAMELLANAGIYVLVTLHEDFTPKRCEAFDVTEPNPDMNTAEYYTADLMKPTLKIVDEMANYANVLAFVVGVDSINKYAASKMAEVYRATVRDIKRYLHQQGGKCPTVGVSVNDIATLRGLMLEYFTAGEMEERANFFAMDSFSWAHKSSFQISGWKNMVEALREYPVPMYLSAFGAQVGKPRLWEEIGCLYSPDMTGVFSGGCLYTYFEYGNRYGIVKAATDGLERKEEFARLKKQFDVVNGRSNNELFTADCEDYEEWVGEFPRASQRWYATSELPEIQGGFKNLVQEIKDEKEWHFINEELSDEDKKDDAGSEGVGRLTDQIGGLSITKGT